MRHVIMIIIQNKISTLKFFYWLAFFQWKTMQEEKAVIIELSKSHPWFSNWNLTHYNLFWPKTGGHQLSTTNSCTRRGPCQSPKSSLHVSQHNSCQRSLGKAGQKVWSDVCQESICTLVNITYVPNHRLDLVWKRLVSQLTPVPYQINIILTCAICFFC